MPFLLPHKQQELPARVNFSTAAAPAPAVPTALHSKMDELEGQLLAKVLALEKERVALSHSSQRQRQEVEKELDALQDRVAGLEHGGSGAPQRTQQVGPWFPDGSSRSQIHLRIFLCSPEAKARRRRGCETQEGGN